jgi:glycosyltransferase involved in cell wall biosynthesis
MSDTGSAVPNVPRVSIGLPVYNGEPFLRDTLDALLAQDFEDFELIISDDGSTDATESICRSYATRDARVLYHRADQNLGASPNFNRVVQLARGEYFRWACHDDLVEVSHLRRCVEVMDEAPPSVALVYTRTMMIDESGNHLGERDDHIETHAERAHERLRDIVQHLVFADPLFGLMRRSTLLQTRLLGPYESSDYVLFAELALLGQFWEIPETLFLRRIHPGMSRRANRTPAEVARWFDSTSSQRRYFPRTRLLVEHARAVRHASPSRTQQLRCFGILLTQWLPRNGRGLVRDYVGALFTRFSRYE